MSIENSIQSPMRTASTPLRHHQYPGFTKESGETELDIQLEKLKRDGYFLLDGVFKDHELSHMRFSLDRFYEEDVAQYGLDFLKSIGDLGQPRALMSRDLFFMDLVIHPFILKIVSRVVGDSAILHLQNAAILQPGISHHQTQYHKDFPKNFVCSKVLSLNAFILVDDFKEENGGTWIVPGSHLMEPMPSQTYLKETEKQLVGKAGSIFFFDSMLWHRSGENVSAQPRRGINQQYTRPFIKQQIDLPQLLGSQIEKESKLAQVLGYWSVPPRSPEEYRVSDPALRTYRGGQG